MYPYTLRNNFGTDTANVAWREVTLENEYLSCRVLPDLGGHLYSCRDKINNVEMFYANPVIRKNWVGLRAAWVALGIELNFPVGHSLVAVSPVSYGTQTYSDGSAGVWVADVDRQTGMEWRVEFVLHPGVAMLEEDVSLYNRGDVRQPYYFWSNGEVKIQDKNDAFLYPMHVSGTHGFTNLDSWPVNQAGVDMSVIKNYTDQVGLFAYGSKEPFMAVYHPSSKTATVHWAEPAAMPGKKLWGWGPNQNSGDPWVEANLTENFPSYIEMQAGVTPNQETRLWLQPQQSTQFVEYWMPARELDGVTRANTSGVLYMGRMTSGGAPALRVQLNVNRAISGAVVKVLNGDSVVFQEASPINVSPAVTYSRTLPGVADGTAYTFQLLDQSGNVLLEHTENQVDALAATDVTLGAQPQPDLSASGSEQDFLFRAAYHEQYTQYDLAEADYNQGLARFPSSVALCKGLARLDYLSARYDDALTLLEQAAAQAPDDHETRYYMGLAEAALGRNAAAVETWRGIQSRAPFGVAAGFESGCLEARNGDLKSAANLLSAANTVRAGAMQVAVLRHENDTAAASAALLKWQAVSPTDLFLRYESTLLGASDPKLAVDLGAEPERVLNLVDDYLRLGFVQDALALLSQSYPEAPANRREPGAVAPQNHALIAYYRGYCRTLLGQSPTADFEAASATPVAYIFPYRDSSFAVLRAAIQANASDATPHFLLGLLYMDRRQVDNAIAEWRTTRSLNENLPTLDRDLGRAYLDIKDDPQTALPILVSGRSVEPSNSDLQDAYNRAVTATQAASGCAFTIAGGSVVSAASTPSMITVNFNGPASCGWTAASYGGWITAASTAKGTGSGAVDYAIAANGGLAARSETMMVAGQPVMITQAGATCAYTLTRSSAAVPASGGSIEVGVNSPSEACSWTASTTTSWLSIFSGADGSGGVVTVAVRPNSGAARSGVVTVAGQSFTIMQAGSQQRPGRRPPPR